jgi:hypothetical protein
MDSSSLSSYVLKFNTLCFGDRTGVVFRFASSKSSTADVCDMIWYIYLLHLGFHAVAVVGKLVQN